MIDLDTIFDNIDEYSNNIDDLVKALKQAGIKSFEEFRDAAREAGTPVKKSIQDQVAEKFANCEEEDREEAKTALIQKRHTKITLIHIQKANIEVLLVIGLRNCRNWRKVAPVMRFGMALTKEVLQSCKIL